MSNALDMFRAQRAAIEQLYDRINDVAVLLGQLKVQVDQIAHDPDLRDVLQRERNWLDSAEQAINQVRWWRQEDARRYWPGVVHRWAAALAFALVSAFAVGLGYGWVAKPFAAELEALRPQAELGLFVEHRMSTMTPTERRQLDALMQWKRDAR